MTDNFMCPVTVLIKPNSLTNNIFRLFRDKKRDSEDVGHLRSLFLLVRTRLSQRRVSGLVGHVVVGVVGTGVGLLRMGCLRDVEDEFVTRRSGQRDVALTLSRSEVFGHNHLDRWCSAGIRFLRHLEPRRGARDAGDGGVEVAEGHHLLACIGREREFLRIGLRRGSRCGCGVGTATAVASTATGCQEQQGAKGGHVS